MGMTAIPTWAPCGPGLIAILHPAGRGAQLMQSCNRARPSIYDVGVDSPDSSLEVQVVAMTVLFRPPSGQGPSTRTVTGLPLPARVVRFLTPAARTAGLLYTRRKALGPAVAVGRFAALAADSRHVLSVTAHRVTALAARFSGFI